jgi:CBS-domain-containing membrane protein
MIRPEWRPEVDAHVPADPSLRMQELRDVLTILPTVVRADESLYGVAQSFIRNPGARVISVIGARQTLVGIIPVTAVTEHFLFNLAAPLVLSPTPTIAETRKLARHLSVQQAKDIMQQPACVRVSETVGDALRLMQLRGLVGLPITNEQDRVVGYADQLELLTAQIHGFA